MFLLANYWYLTAHFMENQTAWQNAYQHNDAGQSNHSPEQVIVSVCCVLLRCYFLGFIGDIQFAVLKKSINGMLILNQTLKFQQTCNTYLKDWKRCLTRHLLWHIFLTHVHTRARARARIQTHTRTHACMRTHRIFHWKEHYFSKQFWIDS